jgi:hypothetical protein
MAHTSGVRTTKTQAASGIALQTEFALLNAKLSEKADQLELAEEQIWELFANYMGTTFEGKIEYPDSFDIRDEEQTFANLKMAKETATDPRVLALIDHEIVELLGEDADLVLPEGEYNLAALPDVPAYEAHKMYDPLTGEEYIASSEEEHMALMAQGYVHKKEGY